MRKLAVLLPLLAGCTSSSQNAQTPANRPPANSTDPTTATSTASGPNCQINTAAGHAPGWPYSLQTFKTTILPFTNGSCALGGCHQAPMGQGSFNLWADAAPGNCDYAKAFNSITAK